MSGARRKLNRHDRVRQIIRSANAVASSERGISVVFRKVITEFRWIRARIWRQLQQERSGLSSANGGLGLNQLSIH